MKVLQAFLLLLLLFLVTGCSNNSEVKNQKDAFETIREESQYLNSNIIWSEEIEKDRLTSSIKKLEGISSNVKLSFSSVGVRNNHSKNKIYPSLEGFGSLDTSLIPASLKTKIQEFYDSFSSNLELDGFFREESIFTLSLFYYDLKKLLPEYEAFFVEEAVSENTDKDSKNSEEADTTTEKKVQKKYFDSIIIGEPFLDGVNYDVPLRLISKDKKLDLYLYFRKEDEWKIDQIQLVNLESKNE